MLLQIALLLGLHIAIGALSSMLAALIAAFMAGLALGGGLARRLATSRLPPLTALALVHALLCLALPGTMPLLVLLANPCAGAAPWIVFPLAALAAGGLGGCHFGLAASCLHHTGAPSSGSGGALYSLDLLGAAGTSLLASLLFIPLYGLAQTLTAAALAASGGLAGLCLARGPKSATRAL